MGEYSSENEVIDYKSFTASAVQRNWKTPSAFPLCPDIIGDEPLVDYFEELKNDVILSHNRYGESLVESAVFSKDRSFIGVITKFTNGIKGWGLVRITFEDEKFVHEALGTFFTFEGASKRHCELLGIDWKGEGSIDDYC